MSITVTNTLHDSGGNPVVGAKCPIVLIGAAAFDAGNIEIVGQAAVVTTDSTGTWSTTTLEPNSTLQPTGTYYMVYEPSASHAFVVPATGGPYVLNQLLVSQPTSPAASLGIVRYDVAQALTSAQQLQAQQNIGTSGGSGAVSSVFGRTGAVVAQSGDYTAAQVGADASGAAAAAQAASLQKSSNLSDVANAATSRTNLGLGTAATQNKVAAGSAGVLDATDPTTTNSRTPSGSALGDLSGSYPGPTVSKINGTALSGLATGILKNTTGTGVPSIAVAADIPTVAAGSTGPLSATDASTTNSRTPTGTAGGDLTGTYPNPTLAVDRIPKNVVTTKGDILAATAASTVARVGVGSDGQVLTADSTQTAGVKWGSPSATLVSPGPALFTPGTPVALAPYGINAGANVFPGRNANTPGGLIVGVAKTLTISALAINVTTAGAAGSTARFGIYQVGTNSLPTTTVFDSGSVSTATTGVRSVSTTLTLTPGDYWVIITGSDTSTRFSGWQAASNNMSNGSAFAGSGLGFVFGGTSAPPASSLPSLSGATGTFPGNFGTDGAPTIQIALTGVS